MSGMKPRERIGRFLTGQPIDRVPVVPLVLNHSARLIGARVSDCARDGGLMGRAHVAAYRRYGQDLITIFTDTAIVAEAMGTVLHFPPDDVARVERPAVAAPEDAARIGPIDPRASGRLPVYLDAVRHCAEAVGEEVFTSCCIPAPFSTAAALRGTAQFARDLYRNPALARTLIEKSLDATNRMSSAIAEAGGVPVLVDPVASGSVISRKAFEEFALPAIKSSIAHIKSLGAPPILHICGRVSAFIDLMADSGAVVLSIDQIDLAEAREKVGHRVCLMGNVRTAATLLEGTPDDVLAEARACLEIGMGSPGGFILASGCEVPIESPPGNVEALVYAARKYGRM